MVFCKHCKRNVLGQADGITVCCTVCGKVLQTDSYTEEATFVKNAAGQSQLSGNFVNSVQTALSDSRKRTLDLARAGMGELMRAFQMEIDDYIVRQAMCFYEIASDRNFTKGRRADQVQASCLYIAFRQNDKHYLLIEFSEHLQVNVYVLGAVFLQLCKLLCLHLHDFVQKPVDPSLYIHRFTANLRGAGAEVTQTALRIIASMKRDWMQTGRKPSGLCGAAIYISALSHGVKCTKSDIIRIVHICEATLMKRLIEFENTDSASLTIEELKLKADELESLSKEEADIASKVSAIGEFLCPHKDSGKSPFAHGLCRDCYTDFVSLSGGLGKGAEPPAFQRAERERMAKEAAEEVSEESNFTFTRCQNSVIEEPNESHIPDANGSETQQFEPESVGFEEPVVDYEEAEGEFNGAGVANEASGESEGLSDIDDTEVEAYIYKDEADIEKKKIVWELMNREYIEEQAAKEAAAEAAREAFEANFRGRPEDLQAALELNAALLKSRKEKQKKRAEEAKKVGPAGSAAEATRNMLSKKRSSSRVNYDVLNSIFDDDADDSENPKIARKESPLHDEFDNADCDNENFDNADCDNENFDNADCDHENFDNEHYDNENFEEDDMY